MSAIVPHPRSLCAFLLALLASACGARSALDSSTPDAPLTFACPNVAPTCVRDGFACDPATLVDAVCDPGAHVWRCPASSRLYQRASAASETCLPFHDAPGVASAGAWGLGGMAQIPTDDGRCLWVAESVRMSDGTTLRNVGFEPDRTEPYGTCPRASKGTPLPIVTTSGGDDPSIYVQIDGGVRLGGKTHVLYRLFRADATSPVGVKEVGGGVGHWDATLGKIVIPSPKAPFPWGLDLDLGDAMIAAPDGVHAYVWGCKGTGGFLTQACKLARLDETDSVELYGRAGDWIKSVRASDGAEAFVSGTWTSSVVASPGGYRHIYIVDYGTELQSHTASELTGPWSDAPTLGACALPAADSKAFCAGPTVHTDIADPTRPDELPVTYGVGTTGTAMGDPAQYGSHLVWVR